MGIDWEEILGCDGADLADAYEAHVASAERHYSALESWDDEVKKRDALLLDKHTVRFSGKYAASYLTADVDVCNKRHIFKINNHTLSYKDYKDPTRFSIDGYSFHESIEKTKQEDGSDDVIYYIAFNQNSILYYENEKYVSINCANCEAPIKDGFEARYKENKLEYKSIMENILAEAKKLVPKEYRVKFTEENDYAEKVLGEGNWDQSHDDFKNQNDCEYGSVKFCEHKTDDGKIIVYYKSDNKITNPESDNGIICTEYTDEKGRKILYMNKHVLIQYKDENGRDVVIIDGNEFSEYDENDRHIIRINGYELVISNNKEDLHVINGVEADYIPY